MTVGRDDCESLLKRLSGTSIVCAQVVALDPFTIKDSKGVAVIQSFPPNSSIEVGDWAYFMLECNATHPPTCTHHTVVPPWAEPIASYQLLQYRSYVEQHGSPQRLVDHISPMRPSPT